MSLEKFFNPSSVAIIGASHNPEKAGYVIAKNFVENFSGKTFLVNPDTTPIFEQKVYESVKTIPEKIDLAVIAVRSSLVPKILRECGEKKIENVVIISSGFSEIGGEGTRLENELKKIIEKSRMRVIGPNCIGIYDAATKVDTIFLPPERLLRPKLGEIAFVTQSGAVGSTIMDFFAAEKIGVSKFISYGNAIDVNEVDLLEFLAADEKTKTIAVYLEGLKSQGRKFVETVKKVVKKKAVVVLKAGKSKKGMEAVVSHTGSLAGEARIFSAVAKQFGLIEAETWEELFDFSKALAMQPLPKGDKLLVVTNGGGFGVLAADEAEKQGLHLAELPEEMKKILRKNLARYASLHNPLDLTADADAEKYELAISEGLKYFDGVVVVLLFQVPSLADTVADAVIALQRAEKPIICCAAGSSFTQQQVERLEKFGIPVYPTPERAVKAFSVLLKRANFLLKRQK